MVVGKFLGHTVILAVATVLCYGCALAALLLLGEFTSAGWPAFSAMFARSVLPGAAFLSIGVLASMVVCERASAAGLAVAQCLFFVIPFASAFPRFRETGKRVCV